MTHYHLHSHLRNIKSSSLTSFESLWLLLAIVLLVSSIMCLTVAVIAFILSGVNIVMLWLLGASAICGLTGYRSIKILQLKSPVVTALAFVGDAGREEIKKRSI
ncbi:MAG: hypothetical protein ACI94Z_001898 [Yoonia sp.]|jgi:hypothetical protein